MTKRAYYRFLLLIVGFLGVVTVWNPYNNDVRTQESGKANSHAERVSTSYAKPLPVADADAPDPVSKTSTSTGPEKAVGAAADESAPPASVTATRPAKSDMAGGPPAPVAPAEESTSTPIADEGGSASSRATEEERPLANGGVFPNIRNKVAPLRRPPPLPRELVETPVLEPWLDRDLSEQRVAEEMLRVLADTYREDRMELARRVGLVEETRVEHARARARENGLPVEGERADGRPFALIAFAEGRPVYSEPVNQDAAESSAASFVRRNTDFDPVYGPDIDGGGLFVIVNDYGIVRQHDEFQLPGGGTRLIEREDPNDDDHPDHVAGTVGAHGYNPEIQGMAPAVTMYAHDQQSSSDVYNLGMEYPFQPGKAIMGTTSLGTKQDNEGDGGRYMNTSFDTALDATPYYLHFYAAGNYKEWNTISNGRQVSKNIITVASARDLPRNPDGSPAGSGSLSGFSSEGPADDGRIKPDLTANGEGLRSTSGSGDGTSKKSGTSMATPNASGSSVLLQDYFSKRFPGHLMRAVSLKNLILHTADDRGDTGPDYKYGWGYMNTLEAGKVIRAYADNPGNRRMIEGRLASGDTHTYTFSVPGTSALKVNLAWEEPASRYQSTNDDRTPHLVNDLDLRVTDASATEHLPWAMPFVLNGFDTNDYGADAVKADNTVDNVEQVLVNSPAPGVYTVTVSHKDTTLWDNYQETTERDEVAYSLILSGVDDTDGAPAPTVSAISPDNGIFHHSTLTVEGNGFLLGANVLLVAPGLPDIPAYGQRVSPERIDCFLPLSGAEPGQYTVRVINPDGQETVAATPYTVRNYDDLLAEDFEGGFTFGSGTSAWETGADIGTNDWTVRSTDALSGTADAHVAAGTDEADSWMLSPEIALPASGDPILLRFVHAYDLALDLSWRAYAADGGMLEITDDGATFTPISDAAGDTSIVSGPYYFYKSDTENPFSFENVWGDDSHGRVYTDVRIDPSIYGGQTVRFRWRFGSMQGSGTGFWRIDDIRVAASSTNAPPQFDAEPHIEAAVDSPYSFTLSASDPDAGDTLSFADVTLPAWLSLVDHGDGTATLSGTPTAVANDEVVVSVSDGTATRELAFTLVVTPAGGNTAPEFLTDSAVPAVNVDDFLSVPIEAEDPDGHEISYSQVGTFPAWLSFGGGDGEGYFLTGTPGESDIGDHSVTLRVSDGLDDTDRTFNLTVRPLAQLAFTSGATSVQEDAGSVTVQVERTLNNVGEVSVSLDTANGSATAGSDYTSFSDILTWADGDGGTKSVTVDLLDDLATEGDETFEIRLTNPTNASELGSTATTTVTLLDNENNVPPTVAIDSPAIPFAGVPHAGVGLVLEATVSDDGLPLDPGALTLAWTVESGPSGALFADAEAEDTTVTFTSEGIYTLRLTADDGEFSDAAEVTVRVGDGQEITAGTGLLRQRYDDISGTSIDDLTGAAAYPDAPDVEEVITNGFQSPSDQGSDFGQRFSGHFVAPQTGDYTFYIASDDSSSLRLSTDTTAANAVEIASVSGYTGSTDWDKYSSQQSSPVSLQSGEAYFIEALHKEGSGGDHLTVRVVLPDATDLAPIPVDHLATPVFTPPNYGPEPTLPEPVGAQAGVAFSPGGSLSDDGVPETGTVPLYSRVSGPGSLTFTDPSSLATTATASTPGTYIMRLEADDGEVRTFVDRSFDVVQAGAAVFLTPESGTLSVAEGGADDAYTAVLSEEPTHDVTVTVSPDAQLEVSLGTLVFTPANWDTPQTVTVSAVDDFDDEGDHTGLIGHTTSSADPDFDNLSIADLLVSITDNDLNLPPSVALDVPDDMAIPADVGLWLEATVTDDGKPQPANLVTTWSQVSGPTGGTASFDDASAVDTGVTFDVSGDYVLRLTADDGAATDAAEVTVRVGTGQSATFQNADIGAVSAAGSYSEAGGVHTVVGSGADIWNNKDEFHYVYLPLSGDGEITAKMTITDNPGGDKWAKAGLMIRETLDPGARNVMIHRSAGNGNRLQIREEVDGSSSSEGDTDLAWIRLNRTGDQFTGSVSTDGLTWTELHTATLAMTEDVWIGMAVTSHSDGDLTTATFENLDVSVTTGNLGPEVDAGPDASPDVGVTHDLTGTIADDGNPDVPGAVTSLWQRRSGPGTVSFSDTGSITSTVTFDTTGTHVLRLLADDGEITTFDEVTLEVQGEVPATVTLSDLEHIHDGAPKSATVTTDPAELAVSVTYDGANQAPVASGEYAVLATVTESGYTGQASDTLIIGYGLGTPEVAGDGTSTTLRVDTETGHQFLLQWTSDLTADPVQWNDVDTWRSGTDGTLEWTPDMGTDDLRVYRILHQEE